MHTFFESAVFSEQASVLRFSCGLPAPENQVAIRSQRIIKYPPRLSFPPPKSGLESLRWFCSGAGEEIFERKLTFS